MSSQRISDSVRMQQDFVLEKSNIMVFDVLTAFKMATVIFWTVSLCDLEFGYKHLGGTFHHDLQC
jgi:hypothetical protein